MKDYWPNFFIVGAARAGTTSLYTYIGQHPDVFLSHLKEPHFFSRVKPPKDRQHLFKWVSSPSDYLALFQGAHKYKAVGEASTSYLWSDIASKNIHNKIPHARIIVLLRDPIERAYSHYLLDVRDGRQGLPFMDAIYDDYYAHLKGWFISNLYIELGLYYQQLKRYYSIFDSEQILIILFSDFVNRTRKVLTKIANFLEIDEYPYLRLDSLNAQNTYTKARSNLAQRLIYISRRKYLHFPYRVYKRIIPNPIRNFFRLQVLRQPGNKPAIDASAIEFLRNIYSPDLEALEDLLIQDLTILRSTWNLPNNNSSDIVINNKQ